MGVDQAVRESGARGAEASSRLPYGRGEACLAIGVGFRKACSAEALADLVRTALLRLVPEHAHLSLTPAVLATIAEKDRPTLRDAAALLGLDVFILPKSALIDATDRITIASERVRACFGILSVAEASALAAAGAWLAARRHADRHGRRHLRDRDRDLP